MRGLRVLGYNEDVQSLAREYARRVDIGRRAATDLVHIAFATAYEADYLVTWNCSHIANGDIIRRLAAANDALGWQTPVIVTPEALY